MNWIKSIFGKKERSSPEIHFEELQDWLAERSEKLSEELSSESASLYSDIEEALSKIKKSAGLLQEASPEGRFHLKMVKIGTSNRDNMVKQVGMLVENIKIPRTSDARTILDFHKNAMQTLTVCLENMLKSYQYAKLVFLEDSKQVIADVNALGRLLNRLIEPINENKKALLAFENAAKEIEAITNLNSDIGMEKKAIREIDENIVLLKEEIGNNATAHKNLLESNEWKKYMDDRDELAALENSASEIESEINGMVLPLNKALNRLKQLSESGRYTLAPDLRKELHLCLSDPKCVTPGFFVELGKIIKSDTLALSPDKRDKMLEQARLGETSFGASKERYQTLIYDIEKKKSELLKENIALAREEKELRESTLQDKLALAEKELETSRKRLLTLESDIELKKQELQQIVSSIDTSVRISY